MQLGGKKRKEKNNYRAKSKKQKVKLVLLVGNKIGLDFWKIQKSL